MCANAREAKLSRPDSPRPKSPLRQVLIRLVLAVIAAVIAFNIPHSFIPVFKQPVSEATPPPEIQNVLAGKRRIVTVGDSITEAAKYPGGYVWLLQRYLNALYPDRKIEIVNAGISGNKATDMQARFQKDAIDKKPDLVTINAGVNDVWHAFFDFKNLQFHPQGNLAAGVPLADYIDKITQMVLAAKAARNSSRAAFSYSHPRDSRRPRKSQVARICCRDARNCQAKSVLVYRFECAISGSYRHLSKTRRKNSKFVSSRWSSPKSVGISNYCFYYLARFGRTR